MEQHAAAPGDVRGAREHDQEERGEHHLHGTRRARRSSSPYNPRMAIATVNPATGETVRTFEEHSDEEVERRLERARAAAERARSSTFAERSARLRRAGE